jgi:MoxR-like ATPase
MRFNIGLNAKLATSALILSLLPGALPPAVAADNCQALFNSKAGAGQRRPDEDWQDSIAAVRSITQRVNGSEPFVHAILTAMIAREFVWLNGDPGGAKTLISRLLFKAALKSVSEGEKQIFLLQFHKLLQEGVITGFPKIKSLLENGRYEINASTSLVGDKFLFLIADEAEKANPATLNQLLSVLNERKALLGSKVVNAALASGVFTSNKTMPEFLDAFGDDRPTGEALADRMVIKLHMPNQTASGNDKVKLYRAIEASRTEGGSTEISISISTLQRIFKDVKIAPEVYVDLAEVAMSFDAIATVRMDETELARRQGADVAPYFPANQFSNRSMVKATAVLKAAHLAEQLLLGRKLSEIDMTVSRKDLHLLALDYTQGSLSKVRPKRLLIENIRGTVGFLPEVNIKGQWDPYNNLLYLDHELSDTRTVLRLDRAKRSFEVVFDDSNGSLSVDISGLSERLQTAEQAAGIKLDLVEFELDDRIDKLLERKTLPKRTRTELDGIKADQTALAGLLNAQITKEPRAIDVSPQRQSRLKAISVHAAQLKAKIREARRSPEALRKAIYEATQAAYTELTTKFPDMSHYIKAIMVGLSSSSHVYAFGPPGGAKTLVARLILNSEIKYVNKQAWISFTQKFIQRLGKDKQGREALRGLLTELRRRDPKGYELFTLQFHKLLPEGKINGFPKLQAQIDEGRLEYNFEDSLASKKFLVAILDEVDKANPAVLTALLSVLNEREVFAGSTVFKASLTTAVLTSNKMPGELLDSFADDRPTGDALLDRVLNKVYISNKMSDADKLAQFLYDIDHGMAPKLETPLSLDAIRAKAREVRIPDEILVTLEKIHDQYMARRLVEKEKSEDLHKGDPVNSPDYYIPAASPSNRTWGALLDQFKARILVEQMLAGVPYENLKTEVEMKDLAHFFEGMGYWGPFSINVEYNAQGLVQVVAKKDQLVNLINSPNVSRRQKEQLKAIEGEADDFVSATNTVVQTFVLEFRDTIAQFPNLFPTLFGSEEARLAWIRSHPVAAPAPRGGH